MAERDSDGRRGPEAGRSAQRRYDELTVRDAAAKRAVFPRSAAIVIGATASAGAAALGAVHIAGGMLRTWWMSTLDPAGETTPVIDSQTTFLVAAVAMAITGTTLSRAFWGRRQHIEAYRVGAEGERGAAELLERLAAQGWIVLHDRRLPGGRENVDHVAVGPPGIVVVETKNWSGDVVVTNDGLRRNGRDARSAIEQVLRQARAIESLPAVPEHVAVRPVLYLHRARIDRPGPRRRAARPGGVPISGPRDLLDVVRAGPRLLDPAGIVGLASSLDLALPPS